MKNGIPSGGNTFFKINFWLTPWIFLGAENVIADFIVFVKTWNYRIEKLNKELNTETRLN